MVKTQVLLLLSTVSSCSFCNHCVQYCYSGSSLGELQAPRFPVYAKLTYFSTTWRTHSSLCPKRYCPHPKHLASWLLKHLLFWSWQIVWYLHLLTCCPDNLLRPWFQIFHTSLHITRYGFPEKLLVFFSPHVQKFILGRETGGLEKKKGHSCAEDEWSTYKSWQLLQQPGRTTHVTRGKAVRPAFY